jgi:serine/threonine protein kinase
MDIKPENICFSPTLKKYIFIDYGLGKIIREKIGSKTLTPFRGSLIFCSKEMK